MSLRTIGKNLRIFREKCGYTQQHLANVLNIDRSTYSYYESGKTTPDISSLILLSQVFCISLPELLGQEDLSLMLNDSSSWGKLNVKRITDNNSHIYDLKKDELQLIAFFRACSSTQKEELLQKASEILSKNNKKELD
ncbi:MAG: helix-turn-helix domain-containing protein [Clostridium sp.]|uniref:helix-turn-helix domain-containing protein n=1 Tax=Clostridium sp. TaxID=1506 RepID=UPI00290C395A|nr:helix-turn-helix domain-containing protein [Clostridium sp.]MDU7338238.1 helix-turn-helix domain-containing protein [Clostridium sp.]